MVMSFDLGFLKDFTTFEENILFVKFCISVDIFLKGPLGELIFLFEVGDDLLPSSSKRTSDGNS